MDYTEYKREYLQTLHDNALIMGTDVEKEFLEKALSTMTEYDDIENPVIIGMTDTRCSKQRIMHADGYAFDETDHSLILFINEFQDSEQTEKLSLKRVDELYWKLFYFMEESCGDRMNSFLDDTGDAIKASKLIRYRLNAVFDDPRKILKIKFFVITNKELDTKLLDKNLLESNLKRKTRKITKTTKKIKKADFLGCPLEISLWHLERLYEMEMANNNEPVVIDFPFDYEWEGIPCIKGDIGKNLGYKAYIAIIPGKILADIYIDHGSKVLEGNVRAFLGTSNAKGINNGIKRTINNSPEKFFTYNNGIAVTATEVDVTEHNGQFYITRIVDLQIINGGQTTATLAEAVLKKTNIQLDEIFVSMKLTVIEDRESETEDGIRLYDQMVQNIARYANSQNKVTAADLFSNDPFHIWMEKASKRQFAPPVSYAIPTGWYYERSRKKYQQEQLKLRGDELKRFTLKFPKKQVINKEQLAMYLTAIACKPHIVSKGKNWVMKEFGAAIGLKYRNQKAEFNEYYFRKCICSAIIYRSVDNYLEVNKRDPDFWYKPGGYKLNIVPYTIAKIISCIPEGCTLNWEKIWQEQKISSAFEYEVSALTRIANEFFCSKGGVIVTEYCKKEETWVQFRDSISYSLSDEFRNELMPENVENENNKDAICDQKDKNDLTLVMEIIKQGYDYWKNLLDEGICRKLLSTSEQYYLNQAINFAISANIPCSSSGKVPAKIMAIIGGIISTRDKLVAEGVTIDVSDNIVRLKITDYKLK